MDNRPIGVFDSGLGGLTAIKELEKLLPGEDIIYFGDTGRVPYGTKGRETIVKYAAQIMRFLQSFHVKAVIIACGTVSSVAFEETAAGVQIPVIGVVKPAAHAALRATKNGKIGILGTSATIKSCSYEKEISLVTTRTQMKSKACPLFVPLVENGHFKQDDRIAQLAAHEYLDEYLGWGADTVILGCTHYPILRGVIGDILGDVTLIDSGREAALAAAKAFEKDGLLSDKQSGGKSSFYVSDYTEDFTRLAGILLEHSLTGYVEKIDIEKY